LEVKSKYAACDISIVAVAVVTSVCVILTALGWFGVG
jgi:hypothetical protein